MERKGENTSEDFLKKPMAKAVREALKDLSEHKIEQSKTPIVVDDSNIVVPQYSRGTTEMQEEMNKMGGVAHPEAVYTEPNEGTYTELYKKIESKYGRPVPMDVSVEFINIQNEIKAGFASNDTNAQRVAIEKLNKFVSSAEVSPEPAIETVAPKIEKTPEEIAIENRRAAATVGKEFEISLMEEIKKAHDQIHQLLRKMSEDPEVAFNAKDAGFHYRAVMPTRDEHGAIVGSWKMVDTYHDLLKLRASIPNEERVASDVYTFDFENGGTWGKIETFSNREKLWSRLNDPNDKLSKYKGEFYSLIDGVKNEQLPDEYAKAIARGEVRQPDPEHLFKQFIDIKRERDVLWANKEGREFTPEEEQNNKNLIHKQLDFQEQLNGLIDELEPRTPTPLETEPLKDTDAIRARIKELQDLRYDESNTESLANYKQTRSWISEQIALENKLRDAGEPVEKPEVEPQADQNAQQEGTPKENRNKFLETMARAKEMFGNFTEGASERFSKSKKYLNERAKEMDSKASEMGSFEKYYRKFGEQYNKLSPIKKLGVGVTLGVGTAVGAAFSLPLALAGVAGLVAQRAAGSASMFLKIEKSLQDKKIGEKSYQIMAKKERAMLDAALYTFAFSYAIKEGLEAAQEHRTIERTREWLGAMMNEFTGNRTEAGAVATAPSVFPEKVQLQSDSAPPEQPAPAAEAPVPAPATEAAEPAAAAAAGAAAESTPAIPEISVEATRGKGYEYMAKRLWEQLQDKNLDAGQYVDGSDARRLLEADPSSINKVVHDIAAERGIYKPDGTSIQINLGDKLSFDAQGNLKVSNGQPFVNAPEGAPVTPLYPPEPVPVRPPPQELRDFLDKRFAPEPEVYEKVDLAPEAIPETQPEPAEPSAETVESVPAAEAPEQAPAEIPNSKDLIARLGAAQSPAETRSILDTLFSSHNVSPDTVSAAIKAAPSMNADPSLVNYIEPNTGAIPGPAVFLGQDGGLTVYGAASVGDTYTIQRTVAERFAALSGQSVKVLLPNGAQGYELVHPDGLVSVETPSFWNLSYKPPLPVSQSVYVFPR